MRFALGATMALRRADLDWIGGFIAVADYLADDFQMGARMAKSGHRVHLSHYVVASILGATTFREQWHRELRWAQCNRVSRPAEYPGVLLTFSTPLSVILMLVAGFDRWTLLALTVSLAERWLVAWLVMGYIMNQTMRRWLIWLPLRDMLSALIWCAGAVGRRVTWRGEKFVLRADGRLESLPLKDRATHGGLKALPRVMVLALDALLRQVLHVFEFSRDEECILRLSISKSESDVTLADGTRIYCGDPIGEIHLWNEHIPPIPGSGADLAWARAFGRRWARSLAELAAYVDTDPRCRRIKAFRAVTSVGSGYPSMQMGRIVGRWGLQLLRKDQPSSVWGRFAGWWEHMYGVALIWAFNPSRHKPRDLQDLSRDQLWISRDVLLSMHGPRIQCYRSIDDGGGTSDGRSPITSDADAYIAPRPVEAPVDE